MKQLIGCIAFICLLISSACSEDKEDDPNAMYKYSVRLEGKVRSDEISFTAKGNENIGKGVESFHGHKLWINDYEAVIEYPVSKGGWGIKLRICPLEQKLYEIKGDSFSVDESMIAVKYQDLSNNVYTYYPLKGSFKINITRYEKLKELICPTIEGSIEGTLYNVDDPLDFIEIKDFIIDIH